MGYLALAELAFIAALNADAFVWNLRFGLSWYLASYIGAFVLLFLIPVAVLVIDTWRRRLRPDTIANTFD